MMINNPYSKALLIPLALDPDCFVKKLTVNGNIGKIQGINNAIKPPTKPAMKIPQSDFFSSGT